MKSMDKYNKTIFERDVFNKVIYTQLDEAIKTLKKRKKDKNLIKKVNKLLNNKIPKVLKEHNCGIMARQLATPNYDSRTFISLTQKNQLKPVFLEYFEDKFTTNNKYKYSLGSLQMDVKTKRGKKIVEKIKIVDFPKYDGKKIKQVKTLWGEPLIDFHKKLFDLYKIKNVYFLNELDWYRKNKNESPFDFYFNFFTLMTCYGILFENFLITGDKKEKKFTKEIIIPAIEKVYILTGTQPLIVPVGDLKLENEDFWYYHLPIVKKNINKKYLL